MVGEMPGRGNVLSGNCPQGICPQRTCTSGKCQSGICPWGSVSRGSVRSGNCRTILYKRAKAKGRCNSACTICFQTNENKSYMRMPRTPWRSHWFEEILTKLCSRNTGPVNQMGKFCRKKLWRDLQAPHSCINKSFKQTLPNYIDHTKRQNLT